MADLEVYASDADLHYTEFWDDYTYKASKPYKIFATILTPEATNVRKDYCFPNTHTSLLII